MIDYFFSLGALLAGFILALSLIPTTFWVVKVLRSKEGYLPWMFFFSTVVNMLLVIFSDRSLFADPEQLATEEIAVTSSDPIWVTWLARINMALFGYSATKKIIIGFLEAKDYPTTTPHFLIIAFLFFILTTVFLPSFFGAHPFFEHGHLYLLLAGLASLFYKAGEEKTSIRYIRNTFFMFLIVSTCFIPFRPELVMDNNYTAGLIPGLVYRYSGLAAHANHLAIYLVMFMVCLKSEPYSNRVINYFAWTVAILSLLLAQSKTSWITTLLVILILSYYQYSDFLKQKIFNFNKPLLPATLIIFCMVCILGILGLVMFGSFTSKLDLFLSSKAGKDLMLLTGRNLIWKVALDEWQRNPIFGYGLTIWDENYRAKIGYFFAVSAHNQIFETMASAGSIGLLGLIVYVTTLFWFALQTAKSSQGLSMAIFFSIFIRCTSESSLPVIKHFGPDGMTHILLLMIIGANFKYRDATKKIDDTDNKLRKLKHYKGLS